MSDREQRSERRQRLAVRAARLLPAFDLDTTAAAAMAADRHEMLQALRSLPPRGVCDHQAAHAAISPDSYTLRQAAVSWRLCPPQTVRQASEDRSKRVKAAARGTSAWPGRELGKPRATRQTATREASTWLDRDSYAQARVLSYRDFGTLRDVSHYPGIIAGLVHSDDETRYIAAHVPLPLWMLAALAGDTRSDTRSAAARQPSCPPCILEHLATDPIEHLRLDVAKHPGCPPHVLETLADDTDPLVASAALDRLPGRLPGL